MIATDNTRSLALLGTLAIVLGFAADLLGEVYVRLVDAAGETVTSDLLGYLAEDGDDVVLLFANAFGEFKIEAGRAADALLVVQLPAVQDRMNELAYYAADDLRARADYVASR